MSILVPVVDTGITLNEVPDKVAFYIELGECKQRCKGCHSEHLWCPVEHKTPLSALVEQADKAVDKGANAIVLMGGTTNGISFVDLLSIIDALAEVAPLCLYSGSDNEKLNHAIAFMSDLTWIKTGSYQEDKGGLSSPKTNQKFYRKEYAYTINNHENPRVYCELLDCTYLFNDERIIF